MKRAAAFILVSVAGVLCGVEVGRHEWWIVAACLGFIRLLWGSLEDKPDTEE